MKSIDDILSNLKGTHGTSVSLNENGRVNLDFDQKSLALIQRLKESLRSKEEIAASTPAVEERIDTGFEFRGLNIVIQIVGSRGDVQPFVALGKVLKEKYGHRVRLATHATFKKFVEENGLEFFNIGGSPEDLMAFMVKNPGLVPGIDTIKGGDIGRHRKTMLEIMKGCWRSCLEAGDGMSYQPYQHYGPISHTIESRRSLASDHEPFIADAIIANPPSFAHIHIAERMGVPLHIFFTMPWSPTHVFPHPIANIHTKNNDKMVNYMSYGLVELLTWQGLGDVVNKFRSQYLHLDPLNLTSAPGLISKIRIPHTYCWSPTLIPKPYDWGPEIDVCGFFFLPHQSNFKPDANLTDFLDAGEPPVYIGFGSIVVKDPTAFTKLIFEAVKIAGVRALVSKGWGGIGAKELGVPQSVMLLGDTPHDWLFKRVSAVVHHGGAGTTAAGISAGKPTVIVPFFGDQPWWGAQVATAGAGPEPIPYKVLTAEKLGEAIKTALCPEMLVKAEAMGAKIRREQGTEVGAHSFALTLQASNLHCDIFSDRHATWKLKDSKFKLSGLAAAILINKGLLQPQDLRIYRPKEYDTDDRKWVLPLVAVGTAVTDTLVGIFGGLADYPMLAKHGFQHASYLMHKIHDEEKASPKSKDNSLDPIERIRSHPEIAQQTSLGTLTTTGGQIHDQGAVNSESSTHPRQMSTVEYPTGAVHLSNSPFSAVFLDRTVGTGRGLGGVVGSVIKFPLLLFLGLSQAFHHVPQIYGDPTVRPFPNVTGIQSGARAAGTTLAYSFTDAVLGLGKLPYIGGQEAGARGAIAGIGRAAVGIVAKPLEGIFGVPGYTLQGLHKETLKYIGKNVRDYVRDTRIAQSEKEFANWNGGKADIHKVLDVWERWRKTTDVPRKYRL